MTRRMAGSIFDDHRSVAENVVVFLREDDRFAVFQFVVKSGLHWTSASATRARRRRWREHGVAFVLMDQPCGTGVVVGIRGVIGMQMREGEILDVRRRVADFSQLRFQCLRDCGDSLRVSVHLRVRDHADVPQQRAFGMHHQIARHGERLLLADFLLRESERGRGAHRERAAIEDVKARGLRRFGLALRDRRGRDKQGQGGCCKRSQGEWFQLGSPFDFPDCTSAVI